MRISRAFPFVAAFLLLPGRAPAQDASFGCRVLLCALASNPSWNGIPYCVPVMNQLFAMMRRRGFSWPPCGEAKTGSPAYEPYMDCPSGFTPSPRDGESMRPDLQGPLCARSSIPGQWPAQDSAGAAPGNLPEMISREPRRDPWYVTIDDGNGQKRFYFTLGQ